MNRFHQSFTELVPESAVEVANQELNKNGKKAEEDVKLGEEVAGYRFEGHCVWRKKGEKKEKVKKKEKKERKEGKKERKKGRKEGREKGRKETDQ
jgi:hypothetical protein